MPEEMRLLTPSAASCNWLAGNSQRLPLKREVICSFKLPMVFSV